MPDAWFKMTHVAARLPPQLFEAIISQIDCGIPDYSVIITDNGVVISLDALKKLVNGWVMTDGAISIGTGVSLDNFSDRVTALEFIEQRRRDAMKACGNFLVVVRQEHQLL